MQNNTTKPTFLVNTSGWTGEEIAMLRMMVRESGTDNSKFIRGLVREKYAARLRGTPKSKKTNVNRVVA